MQKSMLCVVKDLAFLMGLDKKLRKKEARFNGEHALDDYTDYVMTETEFDKVMQILEEDSLLLYPINSSEKYAGFMIARINDKETRHFTEGMMAFTEQQLPQNYDTKRLSNILSIKRHFTLVERVEPPEPKGNHLRVYDHTA